MSEETRTLSIRPHEWALLAAGSLLLLHYGWLMDDAFVYFRYADNAAFLGRGLVYNPGEFVEGFSSPLWMCLLLALRWLGMGFWWIVRLVGLLSFALFWLASIRVHRRLSSPQAPVWNLPLVFLSLSYPVLSHFTSGLETPLIQLAAPVVALALLEPRNSRWDWAVAPLPLLRHELLPVVVLVAFFRWRANRAFPWQLCSLSTGLLATWIFFRVFYYASFVPNTFHLKMGLQPVQGLRYLWQLLSNYALLPLLVGQAALLFWPRRLEALRTRQKLWLLALPQVVYCVAIGGDWVHYRFLAFPLPLLMLSFGGALEGAARQRPRLAWSLLGLIALSSLLSYPPQLEKPAIFGMSHLGDPEERLVDSIYDANAHRRQPVLRHDFWEMTDPRDPLARYSEFVQPPVTPIVVEGWCHEAYRLFDHRVIHRWGLTDPVLARLDVPAALSGHRYALRSFAEDLAEARAPLGGPTEIRASSDNPAPRWMLDNESTLRAIEARMFNQHDIVANFRMAMETVDRIRVDWGNSHQPNIVLLLGPMPAEQRRSLLSGGRRPRADGEIPIVQTELRRIGYECAFIGEWNLSEDDSKHRDFERWIVTRADTAWESPTLMVERALIHYSTPLLPLLSEFASHYVGQDHARPYFLTVSYPSKPGAGPLLPESADALLRQLEAGEPTLIVRVEFDEPEDRMRYTLRPAARAAADFTRLSSNAALLPTLRKAVGLSPLPDLPGRPLESDAAAGSSSDR